MKNEINYDMKFNIFIVFLYFLSFCGSSLTVRSYEFKLTDRREIEKGEKEQIKKNLPKIAIIIDDIGAEDNFSDLEEFLLLDAILTFAILPESERAKEDADLLLRLKHEIILHLPLEPHESELINKYEFLILNMTAEQTKEILYKHINSLKGIKGINTHMGSKYTQNEEKMKIILEEIKKRNLYFIDSRTDPLTKGEEIAVSLSIRTKHRDCFIDNDKNVDMILKNLSFLTETAIKNGSALGIGHPYKNTADTLRIWSKQNGINFIIVPVSEIVK